ncbi:MAG: hypothetical protein HY683_04230 [Chloroflexi bacterium]|nr:hypothetical protein [Chloroflexota bacterium]
MPTPPDLDRLTRYSFFFQFQFTLESPYISRDDDAFHIMDNPVRKDKVFQVPTVSAASWKGNLRWTAMKTDLEPVRDNPEQFARRRLRHTLLFGTEKGFETSRDWERFLDHRCATEADHAERCRDEACRKVHDSYRSLLRQEFRRSGGQALPHLAGSLHFYPTFFDKIGLEVINPHDRRTRAGRQPIFFECAPVTAKGTFSLLYVPLGQVTRVEALQDLATVEKAVSEMMLTYGFSAKKSSGFGTAMVKAGKLVLPGSPEQRFKTFTGLQDLVRLARQGQGTAEDS